MLVQSRWRCALALVAFATHAAAQVVLEWDHAPQLPGATRTGVGKAIPLPDGSWYLVTSRLQFSSGAKNWLPTEGVLQRYNAAGALIGSYSLVAGSSGALGEVAVDSTYAQGTDECSSPHVMTGNSFFVANGGMTTGTYGQGGPRGTIERVVWFSWTADKTGPATLSTCSFALCETKIRVDFDNTCPPAAAIACSDGVSGTSATFNLSNGLAIEWE